MMEHHSILKRRVQSSGAGGSAPATSLSFSPSPSSAPSPSASSSSVQPTTTTTAPPHATTVFTFGTDVSSSSSATSSTAASIGILWDLDGTLVNSAPLCIDATNHVLRLHGFDKVVEPPEYHEGCRYITSRRLAFHATGNPDDTALGDALGASFDAYYIDLVTTLNVTIIAGIKSILEKYASDERCVLGVLSNACGKYVRKVCDVHEISHLFAVRYGADDVFKAKPEPEGLFKCALDMSVPAPSCLYVGDAITDALAARAAGMRSVGVSWIDPASYATQEFRDAFDVIVTSTDDLVKEIDSHISACMHKSSAVAKNTSSHVHHKVVWDDAVVDNENAHKYRTDNEYWDGRR